MKQEKINNRLIVDFAESILENDQYVSIKMKGYSMYPTLRPDDIGVIEHCAPENLKTGDIIVFKSNRHLVAHRLIAIKKENNNFQFTAKGDKNSFTDPVFSQETLVGRIKELERKGKKISTDSRSMKWKRQLSLRYPTITEAYSNIVLGIQYRTDTIRSNYRSLKSNVSKISKGSGKLFGINAIISVLQGIVPFAIIVLIKLLVDALTTSNFENATGQAYYGGMLFLTALVFLLNALLIELRSYYSERMSQSVSRHIYSVLHAKHSKLDLSNYENPKQQDSMHRAVQEASFRPVKILNALLTGIKSVASVLFLIGMFISIRWYLILILIVAVLPDVYVRLKYSRKLYKLKDTQSTKEREMYYYNRILTGFPFAKELKLFGFSGFFEKRFNRTQDELFDEKIKLRKSELRLNFFSQSFAVLLIFISLGFISFLKVNGAISIGTVVLFFFAFQRAYSVLNDFFRSFTQIVEDNTFLKDFIQFLDLPERTLNVTPTSEFSLQHEIRFKDVSFRYVASKRNALTDINLVIPAGKKVAFVGENGSGKTTLIKLLCGFYEANQGEITFDGIDIEKLGQKLITENITAVFQDFALYNIAAYQNLALGNIKAEPDPEKIKQAACDADIDELLSKLPDGYNTLLGNLFKSGEELSIGQWQKIAIARAFYRDAPLLLMDEPSSALDAASELQIINSLKKLSQNKTAVIVSHRLSTVQWVDLIYMFHEGKVVESGSHEELIALKGKYYELFQTANTIA